MKDVTIVATTWLPPGHEKDRFDTFMKSLISWRDFLDSSSQINLHVSDDGTLGDWYELLVSNVMRLWSRGGISISQQARLGVGASLNKGLEMAFEDSPIILHAVDDWQLMQDLNIDPWIEFIEDPRYNPSIVRFFPHPDLTGMMKHIPPYGWATVLDHHHYVFSFRPALWHKRLFDSLGYFKEGVSAVAVEQDFNAKVINTRQGVWLAIPELWRHIGEESYSEVVPA